MKKYIIFLFLILPFWAIAQNLEPTQSTFVVPAISQTPTYLSGDLPYFQQTKFVKGVHWDYTPRLGKVLGMTQQDINNFQYTGAPYHEAEPTELNNNTLLHVKLQRWVRYDAQLQRDIYETLWTHCQGPDIVNARGIEYAKLLKQLLNKNFKSTIDFLFFFLIFKVTVCKCKIQWIPIFTFR